jgi:hypothetical protein
MTPIKTLTLERTQAPERTRRPRPIKRDDPRFGQDGHDFECIEHLVDDDPNTALCGADQTDVPWDLGWPVCQACAAVDQGRLN